MDTPDFSEFPDENIVLADDFGDPETLLNSRNWLEKALKSAGAKFDGSAGIGCGQADIDIKLEGCRYNVSIKPLTKI